MTQEEIKETLEIELSLYKLHDEDQQINEKDLNSVSQFLYSLHLKSKIKMLEELPQSRGNKFASPAVDMLHIWDIVEKLKSELTKIEKE
jgi:hypothetical protein